MGQGWSMMDPFTKRFRGLKSKCGKVITSGKEGGGSSVKKQNLTERMRQIMVGCVICSGI